MSSNSIGAPASKSFPSDDFGNAITSRIVDAPVNNATIRSKPVNKYTQTEE